MHYREQSLPWLLQTITSKLQPRQTLRRVVASRPATDKSTTMSAVKPSHKRKADHRSSSEQANEHEETKEEQATPHHHQPPAPLPRKRKFRLRKQRYRDQLQSRQELLQLDINSLKQEILDLQLRKSLIQTQQLYRRQAQVHSASNIVHEYFDLFEHGVLPASRPNSPSCELLNPLERMASKQWHFLQNHVHKQLEFGTSVGIEMFLTQWRRYSECHRRLVLQRITIEVVGDWKAPIVASTANLGGYITRDTIEMIFPHILAREELCQRLIGVFIEYPVDMKFHFNEQGQVIRYDAHVDFVKALMTVLGRIEEVTMIVQQALVTEYCMIGKLDSPHQSLEEQDAMQVDLVTVSSSPTAAATDAKSKLDLEFILS